MPSGEEERSEGTWELRSWLGVVGAWGLTRALAFDDARECDEGDVGEGMLILFYGLHVCIQV